MGEKFIDPNSGKATQPGGASALSGLPPVTAPMTALDYGVKDPDEGTAPEQAAADAAAAGEDPVQAAKAAQQQLDEGLAENQVRSNVPGDEVPEQGGGGTNTEGQPEPTPGTDGGGAPEGAEGGEPTGSEEGGEPSEGDDDGPTKEELMEKAKALDIAGRSKMDKDELAKAVADAEAK